MSNIYALIVAAPATAKKYCRQGSSNWELRNVRARYGMSDSPNESLRTETLSGCFAIVTMEVYPHTLRTLLRVIRDEPYDSFPYPPKTYAQEKTVQKILEKEIPYFYGDSRSEAPWLWKIPEEILETLAEMETKKEISELAKSWRATLDTYTKPWCTLKEMNSLLKDLQHASAEAIRTNKKVFLYCST